MQNKTTLKYIILSCIVVFTITILYAFLTFLNSKQKEVTSAAVSAVSNATGEWLAGFDSLIYLLANTPILKTGDNARIEQFLESIAPSLPSAVDKLIYVDKDGNGHYQTGEKFVLKDRVYYRAIVVDKTVEKMHANPHVARSNGNIVIAFVHAVKDKTGSVHGALYCSVRLSQLNEMIQKFQLGNNGTNVLFDAEGRLFLHKNEKIIMNLTLANSEKFGFKNLSTQTQDILSTPSGIVYYKNADGDQRVMFYNHIGDMSGWIYGIALDQNFFAQNNYLFIGAIFVVLIALSAVILLYTEEIINLLKRAVGRKR